MESAKEAVLSVAPAGETIEWSGQSREENNSSSSTMKTLAMALVFAFLCLAALYESWSVPFAVLFTVPTGIFGALFSEYAINKNGSASRIDQGWFPEQRLHADRHYHDHRSGGKECHPDR